MLIVLAYVPACLPQVVHVEMIRAYGRLLGMVLQRGKLLRQLQTATANLQKEAMDWHEVPASKEVACYKIKDQIDQLSRDIQVRWKTDLAVYGWFIVCSSCI